MCLRCQLDDQKKLGLAAINCKQRQLEHVNLVECSLQAMKPRSGCHLCSDTTSEAHLLPDEALVLGHPQRRLQRVALAGHQEPEQPVRLELRVQLHLRL